jgi:hypothetical protein
MLATWGFHHLHLNSVPLLRNLSPPPFHDCRRIVGRGISRKLLKTSRSAGSNPAAGTSLWALRA